MYNIIFNVWNVIGLISTTHPSKKLQLEANRNDMLISDFMMMISLNDSLYEAILYYSRSKNGKKLLGPRKRFLQSEFRD